MQGRESDAEGAAASPQRAGGPSTRPDGSRLRPQPPVLDLKATEVTPPGPESESVAAADSIPDAEQPAAAAAPPLDTGAGEIAAAPPPDALSRTADAAADPTMKRPDDGRRRSAGGGVVVAAIIGGAVAGALTGGALVWTLGAHNQNADLAIATQRIDRAEAGLQALSARVGASDEILRLLKPVPSEVSRLDAALKARPAASDPAFGSRLTALDSTSKSLESQVATLRQRLDQAAATAESARLAAARTAGSSSAAATNAANGVQDLGRQVQTLEASVQSLSARVGVPDRAARFATAALALQIAVEQGRPYAAELAALEHDGADAAKLAPLRAFASAGVPAPDALMRSLSAAIDTLPAQQPVAGADADTVLGRLRNMTSGLVRITPAGEPRANAPDALAAVRTLVARGDLAGAAAAAETLPEPARSKLAPFAAQVRARAAALEAARNLTQDSLRALGQDRREPERQ